MKIRNMRGKVIIIAAVVLFSLTALVAKMFSFAAYTDASRAKKVISTGNAQVFFSGKYLELYPIGSLPEDIATQMVVTSGEGMITTSVNNFLLGNKGLANSDDIIYDLSVTIIPPENEQTTPNYQDETAYSIKVDGVTIGFNSSGVASKNALMLRGGRWDDNELIINVPTETKFSILALPNEAVRYATSNQMLYGVLQKAYVQQSGGSEVGWEGQLRVAEMSVANSTGFIYQVTGTGAGTITVEWDSTQMEIEEGFAARTGLTVTQASNGDRKSVSFPVTENGSGTYEIRFFKAQGFDLSDWNEINDCFGLTFSRG